MKRADAGARAVDLLGELVAIPSVTGSEAAAVDFLEARLSASRCGWSIESIPVSAGRRNLFVHAGGATVVLTTHIDTVPDFFAPRRKGNWLVGRGACDAKGSLAAQLTALEELRDTGEAGLLVLVGEERGSDGALAANLRPFPARYLVGGEPTENRFVGGSKGCLRVSVETRGTAGHSSSEERASAVDPLLDLLRDMRSLAFPPDPTFGNTTMNIGVLSAGTAPNVTADRARAEILFRTGRPVEEVLQGLENLTAGVAELEVPYRSEPIRFRVPRGQEAEIVSFACDLPLLTRWGEPILVGPGSIRDAHTAEEKVELSQIEEAVSIYEGLAEGLLSSGEAYLEPEG